VEKAKGLSTPMSADEGKAARPLSRARGRLDLLDAADLARSRRSTFVVLAKSATIDVFLERHPVCLDAWDASHGEATEPDV
jgi:hypothetical protein